MCLKSTILSFYLSLCPLCLAHSWYSINIGSGWRKATKQGIQEVSQGATTFTLLCHTCNGVIWQTFLFITKGVLRTLCLFRRNIELVDICLRTWTFWSFLRTDFLVLNHLMTVKLWASYLTFPGLTFFMYKMGGENNSTYLRGFLWGLYELIHIKDLRVTGTYTHLVPAIIITIIKLLRVGDELKKSKLIPKFCLSGEWSCSLWAFCFV